MKTKGLILLLLIWGCVSCDVSQSFIIDGEKEYVLSCECGTIKIRGSSLPTMSILMGCTFNGEYHVNTDSLKIEPSNEVTVTNIRFRLNNDDFTGKEIEMKAGESLSIWFNLESTTPFHRPDIIISLLPSNFITCEGKPIITDTIRIQLKN